MTENTALFETEVGSKMWGMNHAKSDSDRFVCYVMPTKHILRGRMKLVPNKVYEKDDSYTAMVPDNNDVVLDGNSHFSAGKGEGPEKIDRSSHELAKVVNEILKNNANFIWGAFSPIAYHPKFDPDLYFERSVDTTEWFEDFKHLSKQCMSQLVYNPVRGMAMHNKKKYFDSGKDKGWRRLKTAKTIIRTADFGARVLEGEGISFGVRDELLYSLEEQREIDWDFIVNDSLEHLDVARDNSQLPRRPTEESEDGIRDFLMETRMEQMGEGL